MDQFDQSGLNKAIEEAEKSLQAGNYPVGAVLAIGPEIVAIEGNTGETSQNYSNHAETQLLINHGQVLLQASRDGKKITLFSTLEPCLMCLGVAVMNKVDRIIYIQKDPHAGACGIDVKSLGSRYQQVFPEIIYSPDYSVKPKELIIKFLNNQIKNGIRVEWSQNFLQLIENS